MSSQAAGAKGAPETSQGGTFTLFGRIETLRKKLGKYLDPERRAQLGQYMTPSDVARLMAQFAGTPVGPVRMLEPGAGVGSLVAAAV
jgi:adenine-specific DNA-methyltransferase